jgi:hypothetical protein
VSLTSFDPSLHGFQFSNDDILWSLGPLGGKQLCGGMVYAALDYFTDTMTIPPDTDAPTPGTPLHSYIYGRQVDAHESTATKFLGSWMPIFGPLVNNLLLNQNDEFAKLTAILSRGMPIPICLVGYGAGHHVLAMDCTNATGAMIVTVYNPNHPNERGMLIQIADNQFLLSKSSQQWSQFFVDDGYQPAAPPALAGQANWRCCLKCQGLFFLGNPTAGVCCGGGTHYGSDSSNYVLSQGLVTGQSGWRWCCLCQGLYFAGDPSDPGICPAGGLHNGGMSGNYTLALNVGAGEQNWRWCQACNGLFFAGGGSIGRCPVNANGHDGSASGNYILPMAAN